MELIADEATKNYFEKIHKRATEQYSIAQEARSEGKDVSSEVECPPTLDLADRTENIIGPKGVAARYRELYEQYKGDRNKVIFHLFRDIIEGSLGQISDPQKRLEQAVRTSLVLVTEGVVVAPLDGVPQIKISKNPDGTKYVDIYFAGPIRAAGGTATVFPLILGDYARELMGLDRYKPTDDEIERYVEEISLYDEIITRQYKLKDDEVRKIIKGCPVCINGEPTEQKEVSAYKDLERIATNRVRGGMCLVVSEGVGLKAMKIMSLAKMLGLNWKWLEEIIKIGKGSSGKEKEVRANYNYLSRIAAGRPIFAYPSKFGGFRLRYGRARNTCIMGKGMHPATMYLLDEFIAVGTQTKMERPGKSAEIFPVDSIEGPIVLLHSGEVIKISSSKQALEVKNSLKEILFTGDLLVALGDFRKTAHPLMPAGYCDEWWKLELEKISESKQQTFDLQSILARPELVDQNMAIELSMQTGVALHPKFLHYYSALSVQDAIKIISAVRKSQKVFSGNELETILLSPDDGLKQLLEKIGVPHKYENGKIAIGNEYAYSFFKTFGGTSTEEPKENLDLFSMLSDICSMKIRDKAGTFIGCRMGRPEAAKPRKMVGDPMTLFPIGTSGGNTRSMNKAAQGVGTIEAEIAYFLNSDKLLEEQPYNMPRGEKNQLVRKCPKCSKYSKSLICPNCSAETNGFSKRKIDLKKLFAQAAENLKITPPQLVKGVKGLINAEKIPEPIEKGMLRARHNLHIFRDATIRFELLNAPLTHFKPVEIGLSVEKAKELGYNKDFEGRELVSEEQLCEIFPQDIIINEEAGDFFLRVSRFVDEELERFYNLKPYYNFSSKNDFVGELFLGLAPHTSAAVVCRIIGYTKARVNFAHPYFHLAKRRNCFPASTQVLVEENGIPKLVDIGSFDNGENKEIILLHGISTYTLLENGKLKKEKVKALFKQKSPKTLRKIKTQFGREITATLDHQFLVFDGKKIVKKKVENIELGEHLVSLQNFVTSRAAKEINVLEWYLKNSFGKEKKKLRVHNVEQKIKMIIEENGGCWEIAKKINCERKFKNEYAKGKWIHTAIDFDSLPLDLFEEILKISKKNPTEFNEAQLGYNKQKSTIPSIIPVNKQLGEIVGYYLADGWARTTYKENAEKYVYQICFISTEKEITSKLNNSIKQLFGRKTTIEKKNNWDIITLSGRVYYDFFLKILRTGSSAKNKHVPQIFFTSHEESAQGLLGACVVGDGHIDNNCIKISLVNKKMINELALMCTTFGLFPHMFKEKKLISSGIVKDFYEKKGKTIEVQSWGFRLYSTDLLKAGEWLFGEKKKTFEKIKNTIKMRGKRTKNIGNFVLDKVKIVQDVISKEEYVYDLMVEGNKTFIAGFGLLGVYDCDGDQDSIMLLMDALLNFSKSYLPSTRGGRMDAPLVFTTAINPQEIDDEVYEVETCKEYPLELYEKSLQFAEPEIASIPIIKSRIGKNVQYSGFGFTHDTTRFDEGPKASRYVTLKSMEEKIKSQAAVQGKIRAVEKKDALERVLMSHFLPDIIGNARSFSRQVIRCSKCNAKFRRVPLIGKCSSCGEDTLILTIAQGSVRKYLNIAKELIAAHHLSDYLKQRIDLIEKEIESVFANEKKQQKNLFEYV